MQMLFRIEKVLRNDKSNKIVDAVQIPTEFEVKKTVKLIIDNLDQHSQDVQQPLIDVPQTNHMIIKQVQSNDPLPTSPIKVPPILLSSFYPIHTNSSPSKLPVYQVIPKEICEEFLKLDLNSKSWIDKNSEPVQSPYQSLGNKKSIFKGVFVPQGQKVFLVDTTWLVNVRKYVSELLTVYNQSSSPSKGNNTNSQYQKKQKGQRKHQSIDQRLDPSDLLKQIGLQFFSSVSSNHYRRSSEKDSSFRLLTNHSLLLDSNQLTEIVTKGQQQSQSEIALLKPVIGVLSDLEQKMIKKQEELGQVEKNCIRYERDFSIILPEFHEFLMNNNPRLFFGIEKQTYMEIQREFIRDTHPVKSELELNLVMAVIDFGDILINGNGLKIPHQISRSCSLFDLKQKVRQIIESIQSGQKGDKKKKSRKNSDIDIPGCSKLTLVADLEIEKVDIEFSLHSLTEEKSFQINQVIQELKQQFNERDIKVAKLHNIKGWTGEDHLEIFRIINSFSVYLLLKVVSSSDKITSLTDSALVSLENYICNYCRNYKQSRNLRNLNKNKEIQYFQCRCRAAAYCSQKCLDADKIFHAPICDLSIRSRQDWHHFVTFGQNPSKIHQGGLTGLQNLQNSCYLNCTLQCLSHCKALTNYFLKGCFLDEINTQNPLGAQGLISIAYAKTIKELWLGHHPVFAPTNFKNVLGRFKKQFANSEQQDSQELLNIILDSLHEDLNRIKIKPLVPIIESHGEDDHQASIESWEAHLKRSQSIIVDLMHGLFKSTVKCPEKNCQNVYVTFEAFNNISLPIPELKMINKSFTWIPYDIGKECSIHQFSIKSYESIANLRRYLTKELLSKHDLTQNQNGFEILQVKNDKILRVLAPHNSTFSLQSTDSFLVLYEFPFREQQQQNQQESLNISPIGDDIWITKNSGLSKNSDQNRLMTFVNLQVVNYGSMKEPKKQISVDSRKFPQKQTYLPRIMCLELDQSLIQLHLSIFKHFRPIFTRVLELREQTRFKQLIASVSQNRDKRKSPNHSDIIAKLKQINASIEEILLVQKIQLEIPSFLTLEKWNKMSLSEQYECVFSYKQSFKDPSRKKPEDLPYFISVKSRMSRKVRQRHSDESECSAIEGCTHCISNCSQKSENKKTKPNSSRKVRQCEDCSNSINVKCIFCEKRVCDGCPLPFSDQLTLKKFLARSKVQPVSYHREDGDLELKKTSKNLPHTHQSFSSFNFLSKKQKTFSKSAKLSRSPEKQRKGECQNELSSDEEEGVPDFQLVIEFNQEMCWGMYEILILGQNQVQTFYNEIQLRKSQVKSDRFSLSKQMMFSDRVTIADCFKKFNQPEKLSSENEWYCSNCKLHKQAMKRIEVFKLPPILILTLKRFRGTQSNQKQNTPVYYPVEGLNMNNFVNSLSNDISEQANLEKDSIDKIYDLFGVVLHSGTLNGGHYTAYAKNSGDWYEFNDAVVTKIGKRDVNHKVISSHAYILFYQQRGIDFDNINDYSLIRNHLTSININQLQPQCLQGGQESLNPLNPRNSDNYETRFVEKFLPEMIKFPILKEKSEIHDFDADALDQPNEVKDVDRIEIEKNEVISLHSKSSIFKSEEAVGILGKRRLSQMYSPDNLRVQIDLSDEKQEDLGQEQKKGRKQLKVSVNLGKKELEIDGERQGQNCEKIRQIEEILFGPDLAKEIDKRKRVENII